jgi:precorrin-8X/cobalt-precorrin-8 methylmutase
MSSSHLLPSDSILPPFKKMGVVVAGHGSREPAAILEFREQVRLFSELQTGIMEAGFLEFETPGIGEAIDRAITRGANKVVVLPAMLTAAHHVKTDIPDIIRIARQKNPLIPILYGRHFDLHPKIIALCKMRVQQALLDWTSVNAAQILLMVVGRGSSDSTGNQDVITLSGLLGEAFVLGETRYCYTSATAPLFRDALKQASHILKYRGLLILPYLLFSGILAGKIEAEVRQFQQEHSDILVKLTLPLGPDLLVAEAIKDRYDEAILRANEEQTNDDEEDCKDPA